MNKVILSTVGTSVLTNCAPDANARRAINNVANCRRREDIAENDLSLLERCRRAAEDALAVRDRDRHKQVSAELNGLLTYDGTVEGITDGDQLILLCTDTYLGTLAGQLISEYLRREFPRCGVPGPWQPENLSTRSRADFNMGMNRAVVMCEETLPGYRDSGYRIVFNLTGGFKSVQGVMSTLGMLYADEVVYIFEAANELLRIPRLPIVLNLQGLAQYQPDPEVQGSIPLLAVLDKVGNLPMETVKKFHLPTPEAFFEVVDLYSVRSVALMPWGKAVWQRCRKDVLAGDLLRWPYIEYTDNFRSQVSGVSNPNLIFQLQDSLATISAKLLEHGGNLAVLTQRGCLPAGFGYGQLQGQPGMYKFRVNGGTRVTCNHTGQGILLHTFGPRNVVYRNPRAAPA